MDLGTHFAQVLLKLVAVEVVVELAIIQQQVRVALVVVVMLQMMEPQTLVVGLVEVVIQHLMAALAS
jgi:hypothetical protein